MSWNLFFENRKIKLLDNSNNDKTKILKHPISNPDNNYGDEYIINFDELKFNNEKIINDFGNIYNDNLTFSGYFAYCFNNIDELIINNAIFVFLSTSNHFEFRNIKHLIIKDQINNNNLLIDMTNVKTLHINFRVIQSIDLNNVNIDKININNELDFLKIYIFDPNNINELKMKSKKYFINNGFNEFKDKKPIISTNEDIKEDYIKHYIKQHIKIININGKDY